MFLVMFFVINFAKHVMGLHPIIVDHVKVDIL